MPHAEGMIGLAVLGVAVNGYAAYKLSAGSTLNERVLNWHLLEDVLGGGRADRVGRAAVCRLGLAGSGTVDRFHLFILVNVIRTLRSTLQLFCRERQKQVCQIVCGPTSVPLMVEDVHHLHVWSLDGEHHVLTSHVGVRQDVSLEGLQRIKAEIEVRLAPYGFQHTTIEVELKGEQCRDRSSDRHRQPPPMSTQAFSACCSVQRHQWLSLPSS